MIDFNKHEKNTRGDGFPRTLYIHGYNGSPAGHTANAVRSFFGTERVVAPALDLLDFDGTMRTLRAIIAEQDIRIVAAHSFGAFYALALRNDEVFTIVANPCMLPSAEIPKLGGMSGAQAEAFRAHEAALYGSVERLCAQCTYGIFADGDELFSYRALFAERYGASFGGIENIMQVHGGHRIAEPELHRAFSAALSYQNALHRADADITP